MNLLRLILVVSFSLAIISSQAQKKYDKALSKIDKSYNSGAYSKASKSLAKFKRTVSSKLGQSNPYMPGIFIREAKINLNSGILTGFETSLSNALTSSISLSGENSLSHASVLTDIAEVYNQYGYYRLSREYLDKANTILQTVDAEDPNLKSRITLELADAMIGQGFCNEAISLLRENESFFASRAVDKESYVEDGKIKNKWIPEEELKPRFSGYGRMLTLISHAYSKKGNYNSADSAFNFAHGWISKNLRYMGETSLQLVYNDYLFTRMLAEHNGGIVPSNAKEKYASYSYLLNELKKRTSPSTPLAHDLYLAYLDESYSAMPVKQNLPI